MRLPLTWQQELFCCLADGRLFWSDSPFRRPAAVRLPITLPLDGRMFSVERLLDVVSAFVKDEQLFRSKIIFGMDRRDNPYQVISEEANPEVSVVDTSDEATEMIHAATFVGAPAARVVIQRPSSTNPGQLILDVCHSATDLAGVQLIEAELTNRLRGRPGGRRPQLEDIVSFQDGPQGRATNKRAIARLSRILSGLEHVQYRKFEPINGASPSHTMARIFVPGLDGAAVANAARDLRVMPGAVVFAFSSAILAKVMGSREVVMRITSSNRFGPLAESLSSIYGDGIAFVVPSMSDTVEAHIVQSSKEWLAAIMSSQYSAFKMVDVFNDESRRRRHLVRMRTILNYTASDRELDATEGEGECASYETLPWADDSVDIELRVEQFSNGLRVAVNYHHSLLDRQGASDLLRLLSGSLRRAGSPSYRALSLAHGLEF